MKLLRSSDLKPEFGISYHAVHRARLITAGEFPAPTKIGARNFWLDSGMRAYTACVAAGMSRREATLRARAAERAELDKALGNRAAQ